MGVPNEIEAACAGWNLLQLTLLTGLAVFASVLALTKAFCRWLDPPPAVAGRLLQIP
ncbi:hypothetical protein HQ447_15510 [bacterium]|nr:hypothetical protein [bacterium]